jgi:hypothetical protein
VLVAVGRAAGELWRRLTRQSPSSPQPATTSLEERKVLAEERKVLFAAFDSDFKAMRTEIGRLIDHQRDLHTLSFVSLAALLAFVGALVRAGAGESLSVVLLLVPLLTLQFTLTASDLSRRILQLAKYLNEVTRGANELLQPILPDNLTRTWAANGQAIWTWESWKSRDHRRKPGWLQLLILGLEKSRWLALTFPGVTAVVAYLFLDKKPLDSDLEKWLFGGAIVVLAASVIPLFVYRSEAKGARETTSPRSGPSPRPQSDRPQYSDGQPDYDNLRGSGGDQVSDVSTARGKYKDDVGREQQKAHKSSVRLLFMSRVLRAVALLAAAVTPVLVLINAAKAWTALAAGAAAVALGLIQLTLLDELSLLDRVRADRLQRALRCFETKTGSYAEPSDKDQYWRFAQEVEAIRSDWETDREALVRRSFLQRLGNAQSRPRDT